MHSLEYLIVYKTRPAFILVDGHESLHRTLYSRYYRKRMGSWWNYKDPREFGVLLSEKDARDLDLTKEEEFRLHTILNLSANSKDIVKHGWFEINRSFPKKTHWSLKSTINPNAAR